MPSPRNAPSCYLCSDDPSADGEACEACDRAFWNDPVLVVTDDVADLRPPPLSPSPWIRTFATWVPVRDLEDDGRIVAGYLAAANRLGLVLEDAGAEALGPIDFKATTVHAAVADDPDLGSPPAVLLAEVRAIILRNPNPFPTLRIFSWPWRRR